MTMFKNLLGKHLFSGIEYGTMKHNNGYREELCEYVKFTLDEVHYIAIEDPEDGYRSCCDEFKISETAPTYSFAPVEVLCTMMPDGSYSHNDVLVLTDTITAEVVMEIGTCNTNNWYPYFYFTYSPENMACNRKENINDKHF